MIENRSVPSDLSEPVPQRYRLVVADDHEDVLNEIRRLLVPHFEVLRAVKDGFALVEAAAELKPDAVICDIRMPGLDGIESGARILRSGLCDAVIVLTMCNDPALVMKAFQKGIRGYVLKEDAGEELIQAVYAVVNGSNYLSQRAVGKAAK